MKLDYNFIKEILLIMEENDSHEIENLELIQKLNISQEQEDKFIGHILILGDSNLIASAHLKYPFGFAKPFPKSPYQIINDKYRMTAKGYEFLDMLKQDTVFNKVKNFTITNAFEIGKQLLISLATGAING